MKIMVVCFVFYYFYDIQLELWDHSQHPMVLTSPRHTRLLVRTNSLQLSFHQFDKPTTCTFETININKFRVDTSKNRSSNYKKRAGYLNNSQYTLVLTYTKIAQTLDEIIMVVKSMRSNKFRLA